METSRPGRTGTARRIQRLRARIGRFDLVCSGTIHTRTKVCGKPNCRCATDPESRHGPYYEWSRLEKGRLVHSVVSADEARLLQRAIDNYRKIRQLLKKWQGESIKIIRGSSPSVELIVRSLAGEISANG